MNVSRSNHSDNTLQKVLDCSVNKDDLVVVIAIFGIILHSVFFGNALIVWSVWKFSHMKRTAHALIANLSLSNNILCLYIILEFVHMFSNLNQQADKYICLSKSAFVVISFLGSECNMLLISVERFIAVLYPLKHKVMILKTRIRCVLALCWLMYFLFAFLPVMGWNAFDEEQSCNIRTIWTTTYFAILCGLVILGFIANMFLFAKVLYTIQCTRIQRQPIRQSRKTMWISFCILFGFVVCWGPVICATFMRMVFREMPSHLPCPNIFIIVIGAVNGLVNWIVYGMCNAKFREAFKAILTCKSLERAPNYKTSDSREGL